MTEVLRKPRTTASFGSRLREKRKEKRITLRTFAKMIGVSATYLSQVEQGRYAPPTAERVTRIAEIFGENSDEWVGMAGRVPVDFEDLIKSNPIEMPKLVRLMTGSTSEGFEAVKQIIRDIRKEAGLPDAATTPPSSTFTPPPAKSTKHNANQHPR